VAQQLREPRAREWLLDLAKLVGSRPGDPESNLVRSLNRVLADEADTPEPQHPADKE
jgi:hypothetical protein